MTVPNPYKIPVDRLPPAVDDLDHVVVPNCAAGLTDQLAEDWAAHIVEYYQAARRWKYRLGLSRHALGVVQFYRDKDCLPPKLARQALAHALNVFSHIDKRNMAGLVAISDGRGAARGRRPSAEQLGRRLRVDEGSEKSERTIKYWRRTPQYRALYDAARLAERDPDPKRSVYDEDAVFALRHREHSRQVVAGMAGNATQQAAARLVAFLLVNSSWRERTPGLFPLAEKALAVALGVVEPGKASAP